MADKNHYSRLILMTSALALIVSAVALVRSFRPASPPADPAKPALDRDQIVALIDSRLRRATEQAKVEAVSELYDALERREAARGTADSDRATEHAAVHALNLFTSRVVKASIDAMVMERMSAELDNVDWLDVLDKEALRKTLRRASRSDAGGFRSYERVDVTAEATVADKIGKILEEFDGVNSYTHDNALVRQMAEFGDDAVKPLLDRLVATKDMNTWAMRSAIEDTLNMLLTGEDKSIILEYFAEQDVFESLIKKYQFPEAEDIVMRKIETGRDHIDSDILDAAVLMNPARAAPLLRDFVMEGRNVSHAVELLATIPGQDIVEPLRRACDRAEHTWEQGQLARLAMDNGMTEGLDLAVQVLRAAEGHNEHAKDQVSMSIRKYTRAGGNFEQMADWLDANRHALKWNSYSRRFE